MSKKKAKCRSTLTTYVVTSVDDSEDNGSDRLVVGVYTKRGKALDEAVKYIMQRLEVRDDLAHCMADDDNHPEAAKFFVEDPESGYDVVNKAVEKEFKAYLRDMLGGECCYIAVNGHDMFRFDIDEVGVEGDVRLHTVVCMVVGTDDNTPEPRTFLEEREMYSHIREEISDYWRDKRGEEIDRKTLNGFVSALKDFGSAQIPVEGDLELHYAVWTHTLGW